MTKHLILPDVQVKTGQDLSHLIWAARYAVDKKPDVIVCIGDFADIPSLCSYDKGTKSFEGRTYLADIEAANKAMGLFMVPILKEQVRLETNKKKQWKPNLILTLGNHENRINRAIELDRKLEGLISLDDLNYTSLGWNVIPFLKPVVVDGVCYAHYFTSGVMGRPVTSARQLLLKKHMSCVAGHQQGRDVSYDKTADGKRITAIIAGSYYQHDEGYMDYQSNQHWRGLVMLNEVKGGEFDEMFISIDYLRGKYA
jgi:hypothetical protein